MRRVMREPSGAVAGYGSILVLSSSDSIPDSIPDLSKPLGFLSETVGAANRVLRSPSVKRN
jgi:hypothetical protein